jgi:hypothetical protein
LPVKVKLASGKAVVGNGMALGITNGLLSGSLVGMNVSGGVPFSEYVLSGTRYVNVDRNTSYVTSDVDGLAAQSTGYGRAVGVVTDATKSGIETSDSDLYLYFYVGETVQNANLINAGRIEETLATKTDKVQASQASMPSNKYIDLTLGASGTTYTAPANGWYYINKKAGAADKYLNLANLTSKFSVGDTAQGTAQNFAKIIPAKKGDEVQVQYDATGATNHFRFIYAEGEQ